MMAGIETILSTLKRQPLAGFILKSGPPLATQRAMHPSMMPRGTYGVRATACSAAPIKGLPFLPISDEMAIHYPERLLSLSLEEVATYHDFCRYRMQGIDPQTLRQFTQTTDFSLCPMRPGISPPWIGW